MSHLVTSLLCATFGAVLGWVLSAPQDDDRTSSAVGHTEANRETLLSDAPIGDVARWVATASEKEVIGLRERLPEGALRARGRLLAALLEERLAEINPAAGQDSYTALFAMVKSDPRRALEQANAADEGGGMPLHTRMVLRALVRRDPQHGIDLSKETDDAQLAYQLWAERDPVAAFEAAYAEKEGDHLSDCVLWTWAESDPVGVGEYFSRTNRPVLSDDGLEWLATNWTRHDPEDARDWVLGLEDEALGDSAADRFISALCFDQWTEGRSRPDLAATLLDVGAPDADDRSSMIGRAWAVVDRDAGLKWASELAVPEVRAAAVSGLFDELAKVEPDHAVKLLAEAGHPAELAGAYRRVALTLAQRGLDAAEAWVATLPAQFKESAIEGVYEAVASADNSLAGSASAWEELARREPSRARDRVLAKLILEASQTMPESAAARLSQIASEQAAGARRRVVANWALVDPAAAATFVTGMADEHERNEALDTVARSWSRIDPHRGLKLAEGITDPNRRSAVILDAAVMLGARAPGEALKVLREAGLGANDGLAARLERRREFLGYLGGTK